MSEQEPEKTSGKPGSLSVGPVVSHTSDAQNEPVASAAQEVAQGPASIESPALAPEQATAAKMAAPDAPKAEVPKAEEPKAEASKAEAPKAEALKVEAAAAPAAKSDAAETDAPHLPGKVIVMSSGDRAWADHDAGSESEAAESQGMFGKRRIAALAAVVALAVMAGAVGGALATAALTQHVAGDDLATSSNHVLETSVARIDAEILALKAGVEHASKLGMSQFSKSTDRLDKLEKAQAEPLARIAKLSEAVDKLRTAAAPLPVPVAAVSAAKDVTGSISPPATAAAAAPKVEVGRLPVVESWVLRDVARGGALIDGRQGIYEVYAGDVVPGLGRIDAIRRQDGRWVVVTSKGLIVAR